jgi:hypothetical protein
MPQQVRISKKAPTHTWASSPGILAKDPRPMRVAEFRAVCKSLKINDCVTAARLFGVSWRTAQRYWYKEIEVPGPLARLLRLAKKQKLTHKDLLAL